MRRKPKLKRKEHHPSFNIFAVLMPVLPPIEPAVAEYLESKPASGRVKEAPALLLLVAFQRDNFWFFRFDIIFNP